MRRPAQGQSRPGVRVRALARCHNVVFSQHLEWTEAASWLPAAPHGCVQVLLLKRHSLTTWCGLSPAYYTVYSEFNKAGKQSQWPWTQQGQPYFHLNSQLLVACW